MVTRGGPKRRFLAPEVVQTSAMDCGPATLKALLDGFDVPVSYGRLREACQTDVDGTSIDVLEDVAGRLGLGAEQVMIPLDHLLEPASDALPAIIVVALPDGATHFVVLWRVVGPFVMVMDPATGRRWMGRERFLSEVFVHTQPVPADGWRDWAASDESIAVLRARLARLGVRGAVRLCDAAVADPGWQPLAALDAATRMVTGLVASGGVPRGAAAERLVTMLAREGAANESVIPPSAWSVRLDPKQEEPTLLLRGAVLVRILGKREGGADEALSPELAAALSEPAPRPLADLTALVRAGGWLAPTLLAVALVVATIGGLAQTVLFRGLLEVAGQLGLVEQRLGAVAALGVFALGMLLVELPIAALGLAMGRGLEYRLRAAFLRKIPRLGDRYLQSRPNSDMAQRSHSVHALRTLPDTAARMARAVLRLGATAAGLVWLDPGSLPGVIVAIVLCVGVPVAMQGPLAELDLRFRTHAGSLSRFYLDAMLGLVAIRTHGAERSLRRAHENLLTEWGRAGRASLGVVVAAETIQGLVAFTVSAGLFISWLTRAGDAAAALLVVYWALELPTIGVEIGMLARLYPGLRNITLRLLEPLGALEEGGEGTGEGAGADLPVAAGAAKAGTAPVAGAPGGIDAGVRTVTGADARLGLPSATPPPGGGTPALPSAGTSAPDARPLADPDLAGLSGTPRVRGLAIALRGVTVRAAGHTLLSEVDLDFAPGEHVAIVGPSGAGKSTCVGLLLGWHRAVEGEVRVDGAPLVGERLVALRRETAWVDPGVQIWNRSFLENLTYGNEEGRDLGPVVTAADLVGVLQKLPDGLQHALGEGGALLSGGEGQRVRLGRAFGRRDARLVILDEPFRGLDRGKRQALLAAAREWWRDATLLTVTHDVSETRGFARVLVIEDGHVVEDAPPAELEARADSRYRFLLDTEAEVRNSLWAAASWRRLRLEGGHVREHGNAAAVATRATDGPSPASDADVLRGGPNVFGGGGDALGGGPDALGGGPDALLRAEAAPPEAAPPGTLPTGETAPPEGAAHG